LRLKAGDLGFGKGKKQKKVKSNKKMDCVGEIAIFCDNIKSTRNLPPELECAQKVEKKK
jgi:hypothetical protein